MEIKFSEVFKRKIEKIAKKDKVIEQRINQKLKYFLADRKHPSLRLHKIDSKEKTWSISIDMELRILFVYRDYGILLVDIGDHNEVY